MAAGEDQPEQIVLDDLVRHECVERLVVELGARTGELDQLRAVPLLGRAGTLAADDVDRLPAGGHSQPGSRLRRYAGDRPGAEGGEGRLLDCVLGQLDVADGPDQG